MKSLGYSKCVFLNRRLAGGRTGREKRHRVTPGSGRNIWGVPGRCPAEHTDRNSGPSGVFVYGQHRTGKACDRDFHMSFRPGMPANDTGGIRHRSGRRGGRPAA